MQQTNKDKPSYMLTFFMVIFAIFIAAAMLPKMMDARKTENTVKEPIVITKTECHEGYKYLVATHDNHSSNKHVSVVQMQETDKDTGLPKLVKCQ